VFDQGLRPPIKFFPFSPPTLVAGAPVTDNDAERVTGRGQLFIIEMLNRLHNGGVKMFGDNEEIKFNRSLWEGLSLYTPQNEFQFIDYIGKEDKPYDWGELARVDYDFDGVADASIEENIPLDIYNAVGGRANVDYTSIWEEVMSPRGLSRDHSFGEAYLDEDVRPEDTDAFGCFALLVGLNRSKRDWVYGMSALGLNAFDLNEEGAAERFESNFNSPRIQEAGSLNINGLQNYINLIFAEVREVDGVPITLFDGVAGRYVRIAEDAWFSGTAVRLAKEYYHSHVGSVDIGRFESRLSNLRTCVSRLGELLDDDGVLSGDTAVSERAIRDIERALTALPGEMTALNEDLGLVSADLAALLSEVNALIAAYRGSVPGTITEGMNLSILLRGLGGIDDRLGDYLAECSSIMDDPDRLIDELFSEFSAPLSADPLEAELKEALNTCFEFSMRGPIRDVVSVQMGNCMRSSGNKVRQREYEENKQIKLSEEVAEKQLESKQEGKHRAERKGAEKAAEQRAQGQQKAQTRTSKNNQPAQNSNNKNKSKKKGAI